jgi:XapX domain-containing protein
MRDIIFALLMGGAVGFAYGLCSIRSPAPPVVALLGLFAMTLGEQAAVAVRTHLPTDVSRRAISVDVEPAEASGSSSN